MAQTVNAGRTAGIHRAVTPSDSADLPSPGLCQAFYVGTSGNVVVRGTDGVDTTFTNMAVGYHPLKALRILATGTTASGIVALY